MEMLSDDAGTIEPIVEMLLHTAIATCKMNALAATLQPHPSCIALVVFSPTAVNAIAHANQRNADQRNANHKVKREMQ